jgi:hypothetical protein
MCVTTQGSDKQRILVSSLLDLLRQTSMLWNKMGDQYLNYLLIIFIDLVNFPDV